MQLVLLLTEDEHFIVSRLIGDYAIGVALSRPRGERVEFLRRIIVRTSARGFWTDPVSQRLFVYSVAGGRIQLADSISSPQRIRIYSIKRMARLALESVLEQRESASHTCPPYKGEK